MSLSDEAIRDALAERARRGETASGPVPAEIARQIAGARRSRLKGWIGRPSRAAAVVAAFVAAIGIGLVAAGRLPGVSTPPTAAPVPPSPSTSIAAASPIPTASPLPSLEVVGCAALGFDDRRCAAIVARARDMAGNPTRLISVVVRRFVGTDISLGSHPIATVDLILGDGSVRAMDVRCFNVVGGVSADRVCGADPQIQVYGGVSRDVPCGPTPCDEQNPGATLPPSPRPAVVAASKPLVLRVFDIPIDHVGHYDVLVGQATLPDGLLSERSGTLGDPRPTAYWIDQGVAIVVRPGKACVGPDCPSIESIYHVPFHGPRPVHVYLVFDVVELNLPGTILEIRNLIVR